MAFLRTHTLAPVEDVMAFQKMKKPQYPRRHWSLAGYPGSGKSSFAAQMRGPKLVIDADHRFSEVLDICEDEVYELSPSAEDNVDPTQIAKHLDQHMPGSDVKTIVVDSLTAIITPHVVQAMVEREQGKQRNLMAAFKNKALAMRMVQDAVTRWGTDVLWIYHLMDARDGKAEQIVRSSVSQTELARLTRSINLQMEVVQQDGRRGVRVIWARRGRSGMIVWDEIGHWKGVPDRIEEAVYGGLSVEEQDQIAKQTPQVFTSPEHAISWGWEKGAFETVEQARQAYETVKREGQPANAHEMAAMWVAEVNQRAAAKGSVDDAESVESVEPAPAPQAQQQQQQPVLEDDLDFDAEPTPPPKQEPAAKPKARART
jgi:hypothetical protein